MSECKYCDEGLFRLRKYYDGRLMHWDGSMAWHPCFIVEKAVDKAVSETAQESVGNPGEAVGPTPFNKLDELTVYAMPDNAGRWLVFEEVYRICGELRDEHAAQIAEQRRSLVSLRETVLALVHAMRTDAEADFHSASITNRYANQLMALILEKLEEDSKLSEPEFGWLIEGQLTARGPIYLFVDNNEMLGWTHDDKRAIRFARREDAEQVAKMVEDCEKITEHQWG